MEKWVIDRFEDNGWTVLDCINREDTKDIPRSELPKGAREGQVLFFENDAWVIDHEETASRRAMIRDRFAKLKQKSLDRRQRG